MPKKYFNLSIKETEELPQTNIILEADTGIPGDNKIIDVNDEYGFMLVMRGYKGLVYDMYRRKKPQTKNIAGGLVKRLFQNGNKKEPIMRVILTKQGNLFLPKKWHDNSKLTEISRTDVLRTTHSIKYWNLVNQRV